MKKLTYHYSLNLCIKCQRALSQSDRMHSNGTCPHCGNTNDSTVVNTTKCVYTMTRINPWWKPWKKQFKRTLLK